jgi:hypothetical protein
VVGDEVVRTPKQQARFAGLLYLLVALSAPIGLVYVPARLIVRGDATATADHLRASEGLVRLGIGTELGHQVVCIFLVLALYELFKAVDEGLSRQLVILGALVSVPILFVNVLNDVAALILVSGADFLSAFTKPQLDALAYLFVRLHGLGIVVASVFWGLWLVPFGSLVIRSGFIPRVFGFLLFAAAGAYLASSFATLVVPQFEAAVDPIATLLEMGELPIVIWLLVWGARTPPSRTSPRSG